MHSVLNTRSKIRAEPLDNAPTDLKTGNMSKKPFRELTFGTKFTFHGKTYVKIALNLAEDEKRHGHVFMYEMGVEPIESTLGPRPEGT